MLLTNEFEIDADIDSSWAVLTDLEKIAPCMPGATLQDRDGDRYTGSVKVKVGPIGATFVGSAVFVTKDDLTHTAVISASGQDARGQASADARIQARLEAVSSNRTRVLVDTDLDIVGKMAQFGRGAIADVSNRLIGQFVINLAGLFEQQQSKVPAANPRSAASRAVPGSSPSTSAPTVSNPPAQAEIDMMRLVLPMLRDRYGQALAGGVLGFLLSWWAFGRRVRPGAAACPR